MKFSTKHSLLAICSVFIGLILCEFALNSLSLLYPEFEILLSGSTKINPFIAGTKVPSRGNPDYPGHDERGFRNRSVPRNPHIIALGDSHTEGHSVRMEQAWPHQLAELGSLQTYNMAFGGYGPAHSLLLFDEALDMKPQIVIEAFYCGNDLFDSFNLVYNLGYLQDLRTAEEKVIEAIENAETVMPLADEATQLGWSVGIGLRDNNAPRIHGPFREFLAEHSKIYGLLRVVKYRYLWSWESTKKLASQRNDPVEVFDNGELRTLLTSRYRLCATNLNDPRITEGLRISLEAMRLMKIRADEAHVQFVVLLLPSKEIVFRDAVIKAWGTIPENYKAVVGNGEVIWRTIKQFLSNQNIHYIDALPTLKSCVETGNQPYFQSADGHPNGEGHHAVAQLVLSEIRKDGLLEMARKRP
jgi:hypothetical protein